MIFDNSLRLATDFDITTVNAGASSIVVTSPGLAVLPPVPLTLTPGINPCAVFYFTEAVVESATAAITFHVLASPFSDFSASVVTLGTLPPLNCYGQPDPVLGEFRVLPLVYPRAPTPTPAAGAGLTMYLGLAVTNFNALINPAFVATAGKVTVDFSLHPPSGDYIPRAAKY